MWPPLVREVSGPEWKVYCCGSPDKLQFSVQSIVCSTTHNYQLNSKRWHVWCSVPFFMSIQHMMAWAA